MKKAIVVSIILVTCLVSGALAAGATVEIQGHIAFNTGVQASEVVEMMNRYGLEVYEYSAIDPNIERVTYSQYFIDSPRPTTGAELASHYWQRYDGVVAGKERYIARVDNRDGVTGFTVPQDWTARKAEMQAAADTYAAMGACWESDSCPAIEVEHVWTLATMAVLLEIREEAIVHAVGWPDLAIHPLPAEREPQTEAPSVPQVFDWIANAYEVEGGDLDSGTRFLDMGTEWTSQDRIDLFFESSSYRQGVDLADAGGYYTLETNTFGRPRINTTINEFPASYLERFGTFGPRTYALGVLRGEELRVSEYLFSATSPSGAAQSDVGDLNVQIGFRVCPWSFCGVWDNQDSLRVSPDSRIAFPGDYSGVTAARAVHIPLFAGYAAIQGEQNAR